MKNKIIILLALVCLLSNAFAEDLNVTPSQKFTDMLEQGTHESEDVKDVFLSIISKGVEMLKEMTDLAIQSPIVFVLLLIHMFVITLLIGFFAAGWAVQNWIPIIGGITGLVTFPIALTYGLIPLLRLFGL